MLSIRPPGGHGGLVLTDLFQEIIHRRAVSTLPSPVAILLDFLPHPLSLIFQPQSQTMLSEGSSIIKDTPSREGALTVQNTTPVEVASPVEDALHVEVALLTEVTLTTEVAKPQIDISPPRNTVEVSHPYNNKTVDYPSFDSHSIPPAGSILALATNS